MEGNIEIEKFFSQFGTLNESELDKIVSISKTVTIEKGDYFIRAGQVTDQLGIVIRGCLRYFYLKDGVEITGEFWQEGELLGSFDGTFLNQASTLYVEAIEDCVLLTVSYKQLKKLSIEIPHLNKLIIEILEKFIVESQLRIASYITETPEERYLRLREEMPGIEERVHQKYIASFVGVTPVTLSRIRSRLAKG